MSVTKNISPSLPDDKEPEQIPTVEVKTINTMLPIDYDGVTYLSWFIADSQNIQNWAGDIFRGGLDRADPRTTSLLLAINKTITEIEDDISKIRTCLAKITPILT